MPRPRRKPSASKSSSASGSAASTLSQARTVLRGPADLKALAETARKLMAGLNPEQKAAATAPPGAVLVLAGAGSGKTRVLVTRIVHLLAGGATPSQLVALTFSNRAAREMYARLKAYAGKAASDVSVGTFHSLGFRLVREYAEPLGLAPDPGILDHHSRLSLLMAQAARHGAKNQKFDLMDFAAAFSRVKEKGHTPEDCPVDTEYGTRLPRIFKGYEKAKRALNMVDFEDLIRMPIHLLRESEAARRALADSWRHFLVDEFQDTNQAQLDLLRLLAGTSGLVFVVGDDDQSIYAWRGAEMRNLLDFETHFRGAAVVKLQQNYRSTGNIIGASNAVIHRNTLRRSKEVFTVRDSGDPLFHHVAEDEKGEVDWLVAKVKELKAAEGLDFRDMALLVRTNIHLREWMDTFIVNGIPFAVKGVGNLLEFPEVQAVLAYAKLIANPADELSLTKVLAFPKRGFPKELLDQAPRSETAPVLFTLRDYCASLGHPWSAAATELIDQVKAAAEATRSGSFHAALKGLLEAAGVLAAFEEGGRKRGRVTEFLALFEKEEASRAGEPGGADLRSMLGNLALDTQIDDDPEEKAGVRLMTVHASKGLEFHTVFLPTLDDDVFPSKPNHTDTGIEEERRLFYVALTRAKKRLFLSWPATKLYYRVVRDVVPSRFLQEIPEAHWDGPLGKKDKEDKKEFLDNFFASLKATFTEDSV